VQVAGKTCVICQQRIFTAADSLGCASCDLAFHIACARAPNLCPTCGRDLAAIERTRASERGDLHQGALRAGRRTFWVLAGFAALLALGALGARIATGQDGALVGGVIGDVLTALLLLAVWRGKAWAAQLLALFMASGGILLGWLAYWFADAGSARPILVAVGLTCIGLPELMLGKSFRLWLRVQGGSPL
jgi:hypothetical protein